MEQLNQTQLEKLINDSNNRNDKTIVSINWIMISSRDDLLVRTGLDKNIYQNIHNKLIKQSKYKKQNETHYKFQNIEMIYDHYSKKNTCYQINYSNMYFFNGGLINIKYIHPVINSKFPKLLKYHDQYHNRMQIFDLNGIKIHLHQQIRNENDYTHVISINNINKLNSIDDFLKLVELLKN